MISSKDIRLNITKTSTYIDQLKECIDERIRLASKLNLSPSQTDNLEVIELVSRIQSNLALLHGDLSGSHSKDFGPEYNALVDAYTVETAKLADDAYIDVSEYTFTTKLQGDRPSKKSVRFKDFDGDDVDTTQLRNELMGTARNEVMSTPFKPYRDDETELDRNTLNSIDSTNTELFAQHQQQLLQQDENLDVLLRSILTQHSMGVNIGQELDDHLILLGDLELGVEGALHRVRRATGGIDDFRRKVQENGSLVTIVVLTVILILLLVVLN